LERGDYGTAEVLVANGSDLEGQALNEEETLDQSLLHRAIDARNRKAAVFLIKKLACLLFLQRIIYLLKLINVR
jgi:hypothetical protein